MQGLKTTKKSSIYNVNAFDSVAISKYRNANYKTCYLKNGSQIHFEENNYLRVTPKDGTGYFIRGEVRKDGVKKIKTSRVEINKIQDVEIQKVDGLLTIVGIILTLVGILGLAAGTMDYPF